MPYCWNCDTEATHVYHNHRKERRYLCTSCADAFNVGYLYGQEGGDDATPIDAWEEEEDGTPEQARPASPDKFIPGSLSTARNCRGTGRPIICPLLPAERR